MTPTAKRASVIGLGGDVLEEIHGRRHVLRNVWERDVSAFREALPRLSAAVDDFRVEALDGGPGFGLLDGLGSQGFRSDELVAIHWIIANVLGDPVPPNIQGEKLVEVRDRGGRMATGARYHQTQDGGSHHTDGPQWSTVPDYVGLLCIRPAPSGGESRIVDASAVVEEIRRRDPAILEVLERPFHFDKRGEVAPGEPPTTREPILRWRSGRPEFRYLRDYVEAGHVAAAEPLDDERRQALEVLDAVIEDPSLAVEFRMEPGQIQYLQNRHVLHGRSGFRDGNDPDAKRLLIRVWVRARRG